ncbi:MAG: SurA N-terminal domain-containing protein [Spirochaetia bacterium]|jgi:hypothetical protein|nr:SurA N-terminal domain-containing protein [Spirochaetia bacterium]
MASTNDKHVKPEANEPRRKGNPFVYIGTIVILIISVLAFVFAPALGSLGSDGNELTFGSWKGKPISFVQGGYFSEQVQQIKAQYESQGYKDSGDQFFAYQVWRRAFENTAVHLALLDYSEKAGISVSDSYIDQQMIEHPSFQENGSFSKRRYRETSNSVKLSMRKDIEISTVKNAFVSDSVSFLPSKAEIEFLKSIARSQRSIEYVAIPFSSYPDDELIAFARTRPEAFRRVRLSKVTIQSSRKDAEQIVSKVNAGTLSFEEAAKNHSKDSYAAKGGDMGSRFVWELKGELKNSDELDAIVKLAQGSLSPVYESLAGAWSFYRVEDPATDPDMASSDTLKSIRSYLERNEKGIIEDWAVARASAFAKDAAQDFASAAIRGSYTVKETQPFPINYGKALDIGYFSLLGSLDTTELPELTGAETSERFLGAVFSLEAGAVSSPVVLNDYAIVAKLKEIKETDEGDLGLLEMYYPTVVQQGISNELARALLANPSLKDDFITAFSRAYSQAN